MPTNQNVALLTTIIEYDNLAFEICAEADMRGLLAARDQRIRDQALTQERLTRRRSALDDEHESELSRLQIQKNLKLAAAAQDLVSEVRGRVMRQLKALDGTEQYYQAVQKILREVAVCFGDDFEVLCRPADKQRLAQFIQQNGGKLEGVAVRLADESIAEQGIRARVVAGYADVDETFDNRITRALKATEPQLVKMLGIAAV